MRDKSDQERSFAEEGSSQLDIQHETSAGASKFAEKGKEVHQLGPSDSSNKNNSGVCHPATKNNRLRHPAARTEANGKNTLRDQPVRKEVKSDGDVPDHGWNHQNYIDFGELCKSALIKLPKTEECFVKPKTVNHQKFLNDVRTQKNPPQLTVDAHYYREENKEEYARNTIRESGICFGFFDDDDDGGGGGGQVLPAVNTHYYDENDTELYARNTIKDAGITLGGFNADNQVTVDDRYYLEENKDLYARNFVKEAGITFGFFDDDDDEQTLPTVDIKYFTEEDKCSPEITLKTPELLTGIFSDDDHAGPTHS